MFIEYLPSLYVFLFIAFFPFIYVCGYRWIYMRNDDPWKSFIYAKVTFLEKFYLCMLLSDLVHFRLVLFLEKLYIFRKKEEKEGRKKKKFYICKSYIFRKVLYI